MTGRRVPGAHGCRCRHRPMRLPWLARDCVSTPWTTHPCVRSIVDNKGRARHAWALLGDQPPAGGGGGPGRRRRRAGPASAAPAGGRGAAGHPHHRAGPPRWRAHPPAARPPRWCSDGHAEHACRPSSSGGGLPDQAGAAGPSSRARCTKVARLLRLRLRQRRRQAGVPDHPGPRSHHRARCTTGQGWPTLS